MMKRNYDLIIRRFLLLIIVALLAITILGCQDSYSVNIEAEHRKLSFIAQQEIQQGISTSMLNLQAQTLYPAP